MLADLSVSRMLASLGIWSRLAPERPASPDAAPPYAAHLVATSDAAPREAARLGVEDPASAHASDLRPGGRSDPLARVLARARRCGYPGETLAAIREAWPGLGDAQTAVLDPLAPRTSRSDERDAAPGVAPGTGPLTWAGAPARQHDRTTCGSAVLAQLAAAGDPVLAIWLETGRRTGPVAPTELAAAEAATQPGDTRFDALQRAIKRGSTRRALFGLPWPGAFGTPPWAAARTARYADVRYQHRVVDVASKRHLACVVALVEAGLRAGTPVPLFSGGTLATGLSSAVPRHVVLVTGTTTSGWLVYEPSRGEVLELPTADLGTPRRRPALGGWTVPAWVLLPR